MNNFYKYILKANSLNFVYFKENIKFNILSYRNNKKFYICFYFVYKVQLF